MLVEKIHPGTIMLLLVGFTLSITGCGSTAPIVVETPSEVEPTLLAGFSVTPTAWMDIEYPPGTRTGIAEIDVVIDSIQADNIEDRIQIIKLIKYPCTTGDGLGGPPKCEGDEVDGTVVEAFPILESEGHYIRPDQLHLVMDFSVRGLLAVYTIAEDASEAEYWPVGDYAVVFTSEEGGRAHTLTFRIADGQIVRLDFNYAWPPFDQLWERGDSFILPPSTRNAPN